MYTSFERSVNAKKQLRDKYGKWIFMGGRAKWFDSLANLFRSGKVIDISPTDVTIRETSTGKSYKVPRGSVEAITAKASLGDHTGAQAHAGSPVASVPGSPGVYNIKHNGTGQHTVEGTEVKAGDRMYGSVDLDGKPIAPHGSFNEQLTDGTVWTYQSDNSWKSDSGVIEKTPLPEIKTFYVKENDNTDDQIASLNDTVKADLNDQSEPTNIDGWKKVQNLGGSTGAALYEDENGNKYVVKFPEEEKAKNEILANRLYALTGVQTPDTELVTQNGKLGIASPFLPNQGEISGHMGDQSVKDKVKAGFVPDAWLANWDFAGLENDNIVVTNDGVPVRVDNGGALIYRAMGAPKGNAFGNTVGELDTLRTSAQGKQFYGKMTDEEISASAAPVVNVTDEQIDQLVDSVDFKPEVAASVKARLKARRDDITTKVPVSPPQQVADDLQETLDKQAPTPYTGVPTDQADMPDVVHGETDVISNLQSVLAKIQENQDNPQPVDIKAATSGSILTSSPGGIAGTGHWLKNSDGSFTYHNSYGQPVGEPHSADELVGKFYLSGNVHDTGKPEITGTPEPEKKTYNYGDVIAVDDDEFYYNAPVGTVIEQKFPNGGTYYYHKVEDNTWEGWNGNIDEPDDAPHSDQEVFESYADEPPVTTLVPQSDWPGDDDGVQNEPLAQWEKELLYGDKFIEGTVLGKTSEEAISAAPKNTVIHEQYTDGSADSYYKKVGDNLWAVSGGDDPQNLFHISDEEVAGETSDNGKITHEVVPASQWPVKGVDAAEAPEPLVETPVQQVTPYTPGRLPKNLSVNWYNNAPEGTVVHETSTKDTGEYYFKKNANGGWSTWSVDANGPTNPNYLSSGMAKSDSQAWLEHFIVDPSEWPGEKPATPEPTPEAPLDINNAPSGATTQLGDNPDQFFTSNGDGTWTSSWLPESSPLHTISSADLENAAIISGKSPVINVPANAAQPEVGDDYTPGLTVNGQDVGYFKNAPIGTILHETSSNSDNEFYYKKVADDKWDIYNVKMGYNVNTFDNDELKDETEHTAFTHTIAQPSDYPPDQLNAADTEHPVEPDASAYDYTPGASAEGHGVAIYEDAPIGTVIHEQNSIGSNYYYKKIGTNNWAIYNANDGNDYGGDTLSDSDVFGEANHDSVTHTFVDSFPPDASTKPPLPSSNATFEPSNDYTPGKPIPDEVTTEWLSDAPPGTTIHEEWEDGTEYYYHKADDGEWSYYSVDQGTENQYAPHMVAGDMNSEDSTHSLVDESAWPGSMPETQEPEVDYPNDGEFEPGQSAKGYDLETLENAPAGTVILGDHVSYTKNENDSDWTLVSDTGAVLDNNYSSVDVESDAAAEDFPMTFGLPEDVGKPKPKPAPAPPKPPLPTDSPRTPDGLNVGDPIHGDQKVYADLPVGTKLGAVNGQTQGGWTKVGPNLWELKHVDGGTGVATNHQMSGKASALYPFYVMPSEPTTLETTNYLPGDKVFGGANVYTGLPTGIRISGSPNSPYGAWQKIADDHWEFDHGSSVESSDDAGMVDKASSTAPFYVQKPKTAPAPQTPTPEADPNAPKDAKGNSLAVGDVIYGGKNEIGKIEAFPLGGKSAKVITPDGQTKFWKLDKATKTDATELPKTSTKYAVLTDSNGDDYVNDVYGNPVYVGDTIVSSGKTGFTGEVVALKPGGTVVIVKDPVDGKNKPRNVNKITKVSGKEAPTATKAPLENGDIVYKEDFSKLGEGDTVHTFHDGEAFEYTMNDGYWGDEDGAHVYVDDIFDTDDPVFYGPVPESSSSPSAPSYKDGDPVNPQDLEKFAPGTSVHMNTSTGTYTYTKNENGEWFSHESNDTIDNELLAEGDVDGNPTLYGPAPGASAKPPLEAEAPSYKNGDAIPATTEAFDALPAGTVVHHKDEDGMTMDYIKKSNGTWVSEADSIYTAEDMADPNMPINYGAADDAPVESGTAPYGYHEQVPAIPSMFEGLPVGTTVTSDPDPEGNGYQFTKTEDGKWHGHTPNQTSGFDETGWDNSSMADPSEPMYYVSGPGENSAVTPSPEPTEPATQPIELGETVPHEASAFESLPVGTRVESQYTGATYIKQEDGTWVNESGLSNGSFTSEDMADPDELMNVISYPDESSGKKVRKYTEGTQPSNVDELIAAPNGTTLQHSVIESSAWTKTGPDEWTNGNGITTQSQGFFSYGDTSFKYGAPAQNTPEAPAAPQGTDGKVVEGQFVTEAEANAAPVGAQLKWANDSDFAIYTKQADGSWTFLDNGGNEITASQIPSAAGNKILSVTNPDSWNNPTAQKPELPKSTSLVVGETINDWYEFEALPVGSTVQYNNAPANSGVNVDWIKTGPNQWTAADGNATSSSDGFYNSVNTGKLTLTNIGPTTEPGTTPKPKVGDTPSSKAELDAAPIGTVVKSKVSNSSYTKTSADTWTNDQYSGTVTGPEGFFWEGNSTFTYSSFPDESSTPTPAPVEQTPTPQPSGPAAVGKNGKGYSVGDTVTHPVKGQTGVVVDIKPMPPSKTGGDASVVTIQTPDGKKYKYQARFLNLEKAAQPQATAPQQIVGPTPQDVDNAPIGSTLYFPGVNNTWTKNADGLWQNGPSGEIKKDNPSSYWKMQNATLTHPGAQSTVPTPTGPITDAQQLTDAPVWTQMVNKYNSVYVKTGPNEWHAIMEDGEFGPTTFTDKTFGGPAINQGGYEFNGMYKNATPVASPPAPVVHPTGPVLTNKQVVDAPVGTTLVHSSSGNTYTKVAPNTWKFSSNKNGAGSAYDDFEYTDDEFTDYTLKGGKYSYGPFDENVASKAPTATAQPNAPQKPAPAPLTKDPNSPWYGKPAPAEPVLEGTPRSDFSLQETLDEISEKYTANPQNNGKSFTKSSHFNVWENLAKNGSSAITGNANEGKFGPQKDIFEFFEKRLYLTPESAAKARAHYEEVHAYNSALAAKNKVAEDKYVSDVHDWKVANGIPLSSFDPSTFTLSTTPQYEELEKKTGSGQTAAKYLDKITPPKETYTPKDKHALLLWKGAYGAFGSHGSADYLPAISWNSMSSDLRKNGKAGYDDPSLLSKDHAIVSKAIKEAIDKIEVEDDFIMTRSGDPKNFVSADGKPIHTANDLKGVQGTILTDYGIVAGSPGTHSGYATNSMTIRIRVPKGAHVGWMGGKMGLNTGENEVLLPPGSRFYVHDYKSTGYGGGTLTVDLVPDGWEPGMKPYSPDNVEVSVPAAGGDAVASGPAV